MQQYLITAWDDTDEQAIDRRMKARPAHFDGARILKSKGEFISGGAMLDETGRMIGSTMIVQFEDKDALDKWLSIEPYIIENVWKQFTIHPFRVAIV